MILDTIGQIFWFGILATPIISFLIVRNWKSVSVAGRILFGLSITLFLAAIFYGIAMGIILRDGLGPT